METTHFKIQFWHVLRGTNATWERPGTIALLSSGSYFWTRHSSWSGRTPRREIAPTDAFRRSFPRVAPPVDFPPRQNHFSQARNPGFFNDDSHRRVINLPVQSDRWAPEVPQVTPSALYQLNSMDSKFA